jgi:hypothetical protein
MSNIIEIIKEFKNIFKFEKIYTRDNMHKLNNVYADYIERNDDVLFAVNCEYDDTPDNSVLNYYNKYWGDEQFNELLIKKNLNYQWYDECVAFIIKDDDNTND